MRIITPNYAKYLLEEQFINSNFEFKCKQCGIDNITIDKMKNEARELSIRTIHTYKDCLISLLRNKIKEIYNSQHYTSETPSPEYPSVLDDINGNIRNLCEYLSDERNRRAVISNDLLSQNAEEMSVVNRLRRL